MFSWQWIKEHPWYVIGIGLVWNILFPPAFTFIISILLVWIAQDPDKFLSNVQNLLQAITKFFDNPR